MLPSPQTAIGSDNVQEREEVTGSADFSHNGSKALSFFLYLGPITEGVNGKLAPAHDTPDFLLAEAAAKTGIPAIC